MSGGIGSAAAAPPGPALLTTAALARRAGGGMGAPPPRGACTGRKGPGGGSVKLGGPVALLAALLRGEGGGAAWISLAAPATTVLRSEAVTSAALRPLRPLAPDRRRSGPPWPSVAVLPVLSREEESCAVLAGVSCARSGKAEGAASRVRAGAGSLSRALSSAAAPPGGAMVVAPALLLRLSSEGTTVVLPALVATGASVARAASVGVLVVAVGPKLWRARLVVVVAAGRAVTELTVRPEPRCDATPPARCEEAMRTSRSCLGARSVWRASADGQVVDQRKSGGLARSTHP